MYPIFLSYSLNILEIVQNNRAKFYEIVFEQLGKSSSKRNKNYEIILML